MPMTKRYLITGAGTGIGRAIAERLAQSERLIILHGRDRAALEETASVVKRKSGEAEIITADLSNPDGIQRIVSSVVQGPLHGLIHNAGVVYVEPVEEITIEHWASTLAVNVTAPFLLTQKLLPVMPPGAAIVNILSVAATTVFPNWSSYCMSKFALDGFSRALREELRPRGIRIVNVYPAATNTGLWDRVPGQWSKARMLAPSEVADAVAYALDRPSDVSVDSIHVGSVFGNQ
jgi:NAD(P)-dependent dehydrogenase (short-subunit alcohol dehydrogenase family)